MINSAPTIQDVGWGSYHPESGEKMGTPLFSHLQGQHHSLSTNIKFLLLKWIC